MLSAARRKSSFHSNIPVHHKNGSRNHFFQPAALHQTERANMSAWGYVRTKGNARAGEPGRRGERTTPFRCQRQHGVLLQEWMSPRLRSA